MTSARDHLSTWLDRFGQAWEERDAEQAASLFSEHACYRDGPFAELVRGQDALRAYWSQLPAARPGIAFAYELLATTDGGGVAHWRGSYTRASDEVLVELDGILLVTVDHDGRCRDFREWSLSRDRLP